MTTATAMQLAWKGTVNDTPREKIRLVWAELIARHPSSDALESDLFSDSFFQAIDARTDDAFRAGFATASILEDTGYPETDDDREALLRAIVEAAHVPQVPGHIKGDEFVRDE
ncbi:MAG: hypothetical protein HYX57_02000 [Chloroflexi bacterium]|nr:hypothetical protein [Chloroflexota bacterium]